MASDVFEFAQSYAGRLILGGLIFSALEFVLPASRHSLFSRLRGLGFWLVYIGITSLALVAWSHLWRRVGWVPVITIPPSEITAVTNDYLRVTLIIAGAIVASVAYDFFYYWFHRLQHANTYLWRFHKVHHALEDMSAFNSNHHFTEEIFRIPLVTLPFSLIFAVDGGAPPVLVATALGVHGWFLHSCSTVNLGIFRFVVADNRWHRIHHSIEEKHHDKNFGASTVVWDMLFKTAHLPRKNEWPRVGLRDTPEPRTLGEFLFAPWRERGDATRRQHILYPAAGVAIVAVLVLSSTGARDLYREFSVAAAPPPAGNRIDFSAKGNGSGYILGGLGFQEEAGRWIDGQARLLFRVGEARADAVEISGFGFLHGRAAKQRIGVYVNGRMVAEHNVIAGNNGKPWCVAIPELSSDAPVRLRLETPDQVRPVDVGYNKDQRSVGFFLQQVTLIDRTAGSGCSQPLSIAYR